MSIMLGLVLPLNFQGSQLGDATEFGHTTLANLSSSDPRDALYLWVHVFLAFFMFPVAILLMRKFSRGLKMTDTDLKITRTLAIGKIFGYLLNYFFVKSFHLQNNTICCQMPNIFLLSENIPLEYCEISRLKNYFTECYPHHEVSDIQIAYDVSKLISLTEKYKNITLSKKYRLVELKVTSHLGVVINDILTCSDREDEDLVLYPVMAARQGSIFCYKSSLFK